MKAESRVVIDSLSLRRIFEDESQQIVDHLLSLPKPDQYLRFGFYPSLESITAYVSSSLVLSDSPMTSGYWFAIYDQNLIVATMHISFRSDSAEFGFTTQPDYRGQGLGQMLFARGYQMVTEFGVSKIFMTMLSINRPMIHIAKKFGCAVMVRGPEKEASVTIEYPVSLKQLDRVKSMVVDKGLFL